MIRSAKIVTVLIYAAALTTVAVLAFVNNAWAAASGLEIAGATWNFSDRSLTTIADISRSKGSGLLALKSPFQRTEFKKNDAVGKIKEKEALTLEEKLSQSNSVIRKLSVETAYLESVAGLAVLRFEEGNGDGVSVLISSTEEKMKSNADEIAFLDKEWNWEESAVLKNSKAEVLSALDELKVANSKDNVGKLASNITNFNEKVNLASDHLLRIKKMASEIITQEGQIRRLLGEWNQLTLVAKSQVVAENYEAVNKLNQIHGALYQKVQAPDKDTALKNKMLALLGVISANKTYLARQSDLPFESHWLELGSVVFKSFLTNPSLEKSQIISVNYLLPKSVFAKDIISKDRGLTTKFEKETGRYRVTGKVLLTAGETRVLSVRVKDVWMNDIDRISTMERSLATFTMFGSVRPLEPVRSVIRADLEDAKKILQNSRNSVTPEEKVLAYQSARAKIEKAESGVVILGEVTKLLGRIPFVLLAMGVSMIFIGVGQKLFGNWKNRKNFIFSTV